MSYGCGNYVCLECYPFLYGCEWCGEDFETPVPNQTAGFDYTCESCDYESLPREDELCLTK